MESYISFHLLKQNVGDASQMRASGVYSFHYAFENIAKYYI